MFNLKPSEKMALIKGWGTLLATIAFLTLVVLVFGSEILMILTAVFMFGSLGIVLIWAISMIFIESFSEDESPECGGDRLDLYRKQQLRENGIDPDC